MKFTIGNLSSGVAAPPTPDPYFQNVVLLGGFNGTNGQTTFTDESAYAHALTAAGTAQVSTTSPKFGTGALLLAASDSVDTPTSGDWDLAALDFTVEGWVRFDSVADGSFLGRATGGATSWQFFFEANSLRWNNYGPSLVQIYETTNAWTPTIGQWYYVVAERSGTTYRLYRNGTMVAKFTGVTGAISTGAIPLKIGVGFQNAAPHLDEWRVTKGIARYASDAGCPVPTAAFPRGGPPWFLTGPTITGNTWVGQVLSVTETDTATTRTYQWKRGGSNIGGATASTYTLVSGDIGATITGTVNLTNIYGTAAATSNGLGPITATNPTAAVRGSSLAYVNNAATVTISLPPGSAAGDLCNGLAAHGFVVNCPTGWQPISDMQGTSYNGMVFQKVLTAVDITAGNVTVTFTGAYYGLVSLVTMVGNLEIKTIGAGRNSSGASSRTVATDTTPVIGDNLLLFGAARVNAAVTSSSLPSLLQSNVQNESSSTVMFGVAGSSGVQTETVNFAGSPTADFEAVIGMTSAAVTTLYTNTGGTGNRSSIITVTAVSLPTGGGSPQDTVDGTLTNSYWWQPAVGNGTAWLLFDFGVGASKIIDQLRLYQDFPTAAQGTWRWEGSNDNSTWTQCGLDFALIANIAMLMPNTTGYRYYRLRHMSGSRSSSPYIREFEFKIA